MPTKSVAADRSGVTNVTPDEPIDAKPTCDCGKLLTHLDADEESLEWGCRVPVGMVDGRPVYTPLFTEPSDPPATPATPNPEESTMTSIETPTAAQVIDAVRAVQTERDNLRDLVDATTVGYLVIQRGPDGSITNVFWPEFSGRLYTADEARQSTAEDNDRPGLDDGHRSTVVRVSE
jgi:hypothetical protein